MYTPSMDWGHELVPSLLWILEALGDRRRRSRWWCWCCWPASPCGAGSTGGSPATTSRASRASMVWVWLAVLLLSVIDRRCGSTCCSATTATTCSRRCRSPSRAPAATTKRSRQSGIHGFWTALIIFAILATIYISRVMLDIYLTQRFIIRWRIWLTDRLTGDWLDDHAYYRARFTDADIDNPDQRIQQDVDIFTAGVGVLAQHPDDRTRPACCCSAPSARCDGGLVHRDPVEPVRTADAVRHHPGPRAVLGGVRRTCSSRR